jgi:DNA-binding response OmpR family regulator
MATRKKILVVDSDLDLLSRIYLGLLHRNYKVEATDKVSEVEERIKRLKPSLLILGTQDYLADIGELKIPFIVLVEKDEMPVNHFKVELNLFEKPVSIEKLVRTIEELID